ncbi:lactose-binding lectin l-2-like [Hippoglossus stenolepis]|uniref:lactose-binding lectin l-2-like n=1 Tax=Hippoglossus stenolepis TaxID=195615 RepID=UPI00159C81F7|nr:lactose-binding lectin l-2-like [Hippoglossus stenolepis]
MILLLLLFALTLGAVSPSDGPELQLQRRNCPMFWSSFNNRCYKYVSTRMNWADAELHCLSEGANLVSIHSLDEHNFVKTMIKNFDHAELFTWIGLSDHHKEGSWMWSDGCAAQFYLWSTGEPNNNKGNEGCVENNSQTEKKWNDRNCNDHIPSVCASRIICPQ